MSRIKYFWNTYGWVFVGTYLGVEYSTLFLLFGGASNGLITPENLDVLLTYLGQDTCMDVDSKMGEVEQYIALAKYVGFDYFFDTEKMRTWDPQTAHLAGSFAVAYVANKFLEPPRLAASVMLTPGIARWVDLNAACWSYILLNSGSF